MKAVSRYSGFTMLLCILTSQLLNAGVLSPDAVVAGKTQSEWSAAWWQWALPYPAGQNPLTDTTGALASLGDRGSVFFLAGTTSPQPVVRSVTVREDQFLFFPVINAVAWEA